MKTIVMGFVERLQLAGMFPYSAGILGAQEGPAALMAPVIRLIERLRFSDNERALIKAEDAGNGRVNFVPIGSMAARSVMFDLEDQDVATLRKVLLESNISAAHRLEWVNGLVEKLDRPCEISRAPRSSVPSAVGE